MTAPIQIAHVIRQGIAGPPGPAGAGGVFADIATQADAEAGADNAKGMTPLRVQQKITLDLNAAVASVVDSAPTALDTLNKLAGALGDDANFAVTTATSLGNRLRVDAAQGLTGAQKTQAQSNIGLVIGTDVQALNANLASFAGLALAADKLPYATAANTLALADLTAAGRAMVAAADAAMQLALLAPVPNASLANSSVTIAGHDLPLGGALSLAQADIAGLTTADTPTFAGLKFPSGAHIDGGNSIAILMGSNPEFSFGPSFALMTGSGYRYGWSSATTTNGTLDTYLSKSAAGVVGFNGQIQLTGVAFASLPAGASGMLAVVTDSNTATPGATIAGGGANEVLATWRGGNWIAVA